MNPRRNSHCGAPAGDAAGFGITEFMVSSLILLLLSAALYEVLARVQRASGSQDEIQGVIESTRFVLESAGRVLQQAGNDPCGIGFAALTIVSPGEFCLRSDLTGSAGPAAPDKGDPDGDLDDSGEDVCIRFSEAERSVTMASGNGGAQTIANNITAFTAQFFNRKGMLTVDGDEVFRVRLQVAGASSNPDPLTGRPFGIELSGDFILPMRK